METPMERKVDVKKLVRSTSAVTAARRAAVIKPD
jgi:hypothetical protein